MNDLSMLLEEDREVFMAALEKDPSLHGAAAAAERQIERVALRAAKEAGSARERDGIQAVMGTLKSAAPMIESAGGVKIWERQRPERAKARPLPVALLAAGALMILATVLGLVLTGKGSPNILLCTALPAAGCGCVLWSGILMGKPAKKEAGGERERAEYTADADKVWHDLKAAFLTADRAVSSLKEDEEVRAAGEAQSGESPLSDEEIELFSLVLEKAYTSRDPDARETAGAVRFYLHGRGIEAEDFTGENAQMFEVLPAVRTGTIRPALLCGGKLIRKGLASRAEG